VYSNQPPGPQVLLSEALILPVMMLLSLAGGAYAIRERLRGERPSRRGILFILGAVLAILISAAHEGLGAVVALVFGIIALKRGGDMLLWGVGACLKKGKDTEPAGANPVRLIPAGVFLVLITLFLMGMSAAFVGYWPGIDQNRRERALVEFIASETARMRLDGESKEIPSFTPGDGDIVDEFFDPSRDVVDVIRSEDGEGFVVYVLPGRFPFFPYNYLTSQPSYRGDETGEIRMIRVHDSDRRCPADAPVVLKVTEEDIKKALETLMIEESGVE
jgi:hypothetical protein